ncbi:hypothetical protein B9Z55_020761 [Caenorhabditis nigoni]|uniref:Uncharacterized protein n=1 Tax=Caenorhabditis nigoni TaxID=1611254 RepID=A0A2G5TP18_9PELO|nr:hypothetical protein B9Z55_020761 [Caenorhabditis nigoni]
MVIWRANAFEISIFSISTTLIEQFDLTDKSYVGPLCYHINTTPFRKAGDVEWWAMGSFIGLIAFQAVVPLASVYVPPAIMISGSMAGIYMGEIGHFVVMSISIYPPLDSLLFLLFIRDYRDALFCNTRRPSPAESSNVIRPGTAKVSVSVMV